MIARSRTPTAQLSSDPRAACAANGPDGLDELTLSVSLRLGVRSFCVFAIVGTLDLCPTWSGPRFPSRAKPPTCCVRQERLFQSADADGPLSRACRIASLTDTLPEPLDEARGARGGAEGILNLLDLQLHIAANPSGKQP